MFLNITEVVPRVKLLLFLLENSLLIQILNLRTLKLHKKNIIIIKFIFTEKYMKWKKKYIAWSIISLNYVKHCINIMFYLHIILSSYISFVQIYV